MSGVGHTLGLELRVLGPLEVRRKGEAIRLGGARPRALLADLVIHLGDVVPSDLLVDDIWGERSPGSATHAVEVYVSQLRKALDPERVGLLVGRGGGYALELEPEYVDSRRFERLLRDGLAALHAGDASGAGAVLRDALTLRRGPPFADLAYEPFTQAEIARLEELHTAALEARIEADLALGQAAELIGELDSLVAEHPFRERPRGQLMLALYRSGRQADALAAYRAAWQVLMDELGIEPGPELRELEAAIFRQDEALLVAAPAARIKVGGEHRKVVTILFADVAEWTSLGETRDAETLRRAIQRYFALAAAVIEQHGGTVEKFAGDAVMAVFGIPSAHEDDPLRAARAAVELRRGLETLNEGLDRDFGLGLELRTGLATGEVVAGDGAANELFATGDAVNLASRLQQSAAPGEIVVDATTRRLIAGSAELQPLGELPLRGKRQPEPAYRLLDVGPPEAVAARRLDVALVGRETELARLRALFEQAVADRGLRAALVLGPAGIGKSRLVSELAATLEDRATVIGGRCLAYGEGMTLWPLRAVVREAAGGESREEILAVLEDVPERETVADRLAEVLGAGTRPADETVWAFRVLCESLARRRPLVLVLDDLHWAAPLFLDLVQQLVARTGEAPILLLAVARDELREERPDFLARADELVLEALSAAETDALADALCGAAGPATETRRRIVETAEGNPLYLEQLVALAAEDGGLDPLQRLPATIQALLVARLDRLGPGERAVLEHAAVVGREFARSAVTDLLDAAAAATVGRHLETLVRRGFVRPAPAAAAFDDVYRFRHVLIQGAVYAASPKTERARLHERLAGRLEAQREDDALIGYHLEQAYRYCAELAPVDRHARGLAADGGARLAAAGLAASKRGDAPAAANLLGRAAALLPKEEAARRELLCELGLSLRAVGDMAGAERALVEAAESAEAAADRRIEARAGLELECHRLLSGSQASGDRLLELAAGAIPVLDAVGDDRSLGRAWLVTGFVHGGVRCRHAEWADAAERGLVHYRRVGWPTSACVGEIAAALYYGPVPVPDALERCKALLSDSAIERSGQAHLLAFTGGLLAQQGHFEDARILVGQAHETLDDLGQQGLAAMYAGAVAGDIELLADKPAAAETVLRAVCDLLERQRNVSALATRSADLAEALYVQGLDEEAEEWTRVSESSAAGDDLSAQLSWRAARAKVAARAGRAAEAERLAREAVALAGRTDGLNWQAKTCLDLAEVLRLGGAGVEGSTRIDKAQRLYEAKGNLVAARRAAALLLPA